MRPHLNNHRRPTAPQTEQNLNMLLLSFAQPVDPQPAADDRFLAGVWQKINVHAANNKSFRSTRTTSRQLTVPKWQVHMARALTGEGAWVALMLCSAPLLFSQVMSPVAMLIVTGLNILWASTDLVLHKKTVVGP